MKWFRNPKIASALGFLILILLIWFVGPFLGVETAESRFAWIFGVMLVWVLTLMIGGLVAQRAGNLLEKVLRHDADDAVMGASPDKRAEVTLLRQRLLAAIDTLKTSKLGRLRGKAALYELPWYMIIGHPAAGKSSAIQHSGLTFPFGDKGAVQGVGGTRNCDWFFSTDGVLLDTAGRYSTQREDRPEWLAFLKLLKKHRPRAPVNGILVAVSFPELIQFKSEQFAVYARQVRERINEIDDAFGVKVPVYLVFTKIDLLGGFAQFFEDMSEEERQRVWGATLSHDQGADFNAPSVVGQQFENLYRGLVQLGTDKLAHNRGNVQRPALFAFPIEFHGMRDAVCKFAELLFEQDPYHGKPLLRGFYFTSALQEGSPRIAAGGRVSAQFDLSRQGFDAAQPAVSNGFFLRDLFREVIFPDQHLVGRQIKPASSRVRFAGIAAGLALMALMAGGLTWSFVGNQKLIASAEEEMVAARKLAESPHLSDKLKALQVLQLRLEQLYQERTEGHPWRLAWGLYQGEKVERAIRAEYFAGVRAVMLAPVKSSLEQTLAGLRGGGSASPAVSSQAQTGDKWRSLGGVQLADMTQQGRHAVYYETRSPAALVAQGAREAVRRVDQTIADAPPASGPATVASGGDNQKLEDAYNALKTYLMLKQKERIEVSHLSDQIPKYWRPWLEANRGQHAQGEINRMAERVVGFYVSQVAEPDLPLIDNRDELVGNSREVLRGALRKLSAKERVYNELKSRANTQFPPMTVGRILNNRDLDLVAGSYVVPGAFTRDAWDKYFQKAILEASKGEVKGDDWVLAAAVQDNLGRDGDFERNRQELEALYKAEYAREWKKFLQGVAVRDFQSLEQATESLGRLADAQNSPLKLLLGKAAFETAWDNPSQLSKSFSSARSSVIERTEKLILGNTPPSAPAAVPAQWGQVGGQFAMLLVATSAAEGGRTPLLGYLDALGKIKGKVAQIAASGDPGIGARQLMVATLNSSGSELADALALVDGPLLNNASEDAKDAVRPILVRPLIQTYAALIPSVEQDINRAWQSEVLGQWRGLASKYPFADSGNEAPMADIARFLKPGEGTLAKFVDKHLAGLVTRRGDNLLPRTWANLGVNFSPSFLTGVSRLAAVGSAVLQEGDGARFELQPIPTPGLSEILIEVDGQSLRYRNGPQPWTGFSWPAQTPVAVAQGARIQVVSFAGVSTSVANYNGRLGLMRLLTQAKVTQPNGPSSQLEWQLQPSRNGGEVVRFNFRVVSGANPLALAGLRRLGLPDTVTN